MPTPILKTKLYLPPPHPDLVPRPRLINLLNTGSSRKLTLISAPAGFGKSTLLSCWIERVRADTKVAWLSLDGADNDLARFLSYFIAALQTVWGEIGKGSLVALQSPGDVNTEVVLTTLLNEIAEFPENLILVLDDYHVIESQPIDQAVTFILEHLPTQLHLIIASRIDPTLQLSRLRARGEMTEIRADSLRFTLEETTDFLKQMTDFDLSVQDVAALEERTEGWIAGLQLAVLSLKGLEGGSEVTDFINRFAGSDRYIQDYLVDEVLLQQPQDVKDFILQTSILSRMSASLCDAVIGKNDSQVMLENLETANLFIVPLDNERRLYRYHHLFADLLRQRLRQTQLDLIPTLHSRASKWYEQNELPSDAIQHAFAANDLDQAASLAELAWPAWSGSYQSITWLGWVKELPDELVRVRPVLSLSYAWAFMNAGKLNEAEVRLKDVERWLEPTIDLGEQPETLTGKMVVVDEEQFQSLPLSLATAWAYHAQAIGNVASTVKYAQRVLELLPDGDSYERGTVTALLGLAYWTSGDLEAAHQTFSDGLAGMNPLDVIVGTFVLADIKMTLGHLHEAVRTCEHALRLATEHGEPFPIGTEDVYIGISELHRELGNLEAAAQDLDTAKKLGEQIELPDWQHRWCIAQARLKQTLGDLDKALDLLDEAESLYIQTPLPIVCPFAATKTRVWIRQGRLNEAQGWARERGLSVDDDLNYLHEFEHITLARVLITQYKSDLVDDSIHDAMGLLKRLLKAAEEGGRTGSVIEFLVLLALVHHAQGDIPRALMSLKHALTLAEPEGYIRIFADEGMPMAHLLSEAAAHGIMPDYTGKLLVVFESETQKPSAQPLIEPLSSRELEVLQLIAQGLTNREIAERLYLALDTIKGHNRRVFGKLGVKNRAQAINKAISLKIIPTE